jgi:pyruvate formate lyase activating enzyme
MNIYHITYSPKPKAVYLHFWGCNLSCRACLCQKEIYDCHLEETKKSIFQRDKISELKPKTFLGIDQVQAAIRKLEMKQAFFMGQEPAIDPELPDLAKKLRQQFATYNILLTNGFNTLPAEYFDEIVFSIKAYTDSLHLDYTGQSNKEALANFISLYQSGVKLRTESILIPEYIDQDEIEKIARFIGQVNRDIPYRLDAYLPAGNNPWRRPTNAEMKTAVIMSKKHLNNVSCLTGNEELKHKVIRII